MMTSTTKSTNGNGARHQRSTGKQPAKAHAPGSPPNLCVVATPEELSYIEKLAWGKANTVHTALALLRDLREGHLKLDPTTPAPAYLHHSLKPKKIN